MPLDARTSYYSQWGDWLGLTCLAISIRFVPLGYVFRFRNANQKHLTESPELPKPSRLPLRIAWGRFGPVEHLPREALTDKAISVFFR